MAAPTYPAKLEVATWAAQMSSCKAALAKARLKVGLGDTLKALRRAHDAVDWDVLGVEGLTDREEAEQRRADLDAEVAGAVKAVLKLAEQAASEARGLATSFKAEAALKGDPAKLAGDVATAAAAYAKSVDALAASAAKAVDKRLAALAAAAPAKVPAVDPKKAKLAATVRGRLVAGLKAVRNAQPGQPPQLFIAGMAASHARVVIGPAVGNTQKAQLLALLPDANGVKWMKGECVWEDKAVTFVCAAPISGSGKRLQRALLEQTKAKLRVRVRKPDGEVELCDGSDDPAALADGEGVEGDGQAADLKSRRMTEESSLRVRIGSLLPRMVALRSKALQADHAARLAKLKEATGKLGALSDEAALKAIAVMLAKVAAQQAELDAALMSQHSAPAGAKKPSGKGPRPQDLSDPEFARKVMALLTPQERAAIKTRADYEEAIARYRAHVVVEEMLGPMPGKLELTMPVFDPKSPENLEARAQEDADAFAERKALRDALKARGLDDAFVASLDRDTVAAQLALQMSDEELEAWKQANKSFGEHVLDGVSDGAFKVFHDIGNIGLAAKFTYDAATGKANLEEPYWFGAAGRTRGQTQSYAGLAWDLAGNIPLIGRFQMLKGIGEMGVGAANGDWNQLGYGMGNIGGSLLFGAALSRAPLKPGKFSETKLGQAYEGTRSVIFGQPRTLTGPHGNAIHLQPSVGDITLPPMAGRATAKRPPAKTKPTAGAPKPPQVPAGTPKVTPTVAPKVVAPEVQVPRATPHPRKPGSARKPTSVAHANAELKKPMPGYSDTMPSGLRVEIEPQIIGTHQRVDPKMAGSFQSSVRKVEALLPKGRKIATPDGQPLKITLDPKDVVPYIDRKTGTVRMNNELDAPGVYPDSGPNAVLARWKPKATDPKPSELVMQHELGHAAMPEIGARLEAVQGRLAKHEAAKAFNMMKFMPENVKSKPRIEREMLLLQGLDELGADTMAVAASKDLAAAPKAVANGISRELDAKAKDPSHQFPQEFPDNPIEFMRRRDFSDGGTIPAATEKVTPYDVFSGVRRHLGQRYGDALTGQNGPKVIAALMSANEQFIKKIDAEPGFLLDGDFYTANNTFIALFDIEAAKIGLVPKAQAAAAAVH